MSSSSSSSALLLMMLLLSSVVGSLTIATTTITDADATDVEEVDTLLQVARDQIPWLESKIGHNSQLNGYWNHNKIELRRQDPINWKQSPIGIFAVDDIKQDELLFRVPSTAIITGIPEVYDPNSIDYNQEAFFECDVTNKIAIALYKQSLKQKQKQGQQQQKEAGVEDDEEGEYSGYASYLLHQPKGQIPGDWSVDGMKLLLDVMGYNFDDSEYEKNEEEIDDDEQDGTTTTASSKTKVRLPMIPPADIVDIDWQWSNACNDGIFPDKATITENDTTSNNASHSLEYYQWRAALFQQQRSWDSIMVPLLDMINHYNGRVNVKNPNVNTIDTNYADINVYTSRSVKKGEEIYNSYNLHRDFNRYDFFYSTQDILMFHGFVEDYPRRFQFYNTDIEGEDDTASSSSNVWSTPISFEIDYDDDNDQKKLQLKWISDKPNGMGKLYLKQHVERLKNLTPTSSSSVVDDSSLSTSFLTQSKYYSKDIPCFELYTIKKFYLALVEAMELALVDTTSSNENETEIGEEYKDGREHLGFVQKIIQ